MNIEINADRTRIVIESAKELTASELHGVAWGTVLASAGVSVSSQIPTPIIRPSGRYLPDSFYATVAAAYTEAVALRRKPRREIAKRAGVSSDVAGQWIRKARLRGFLSSTSPGTVRA